jgi:hypothetical protein
MSAINNKLSPCPCRNIFPKNKKPAESRPRFFLNRVFGCFSATGGSSKHNKKPFTKKIVSKVEKLLQKIDKRQQKDTLDLF